MEIDKDNESIDFEGISSDNIVNEENTFVNPLGGSSQKNLQPYVGMEFESLNAAEEFYKLFAKQEGFGYRIRTSKTAVRSTEVISRIYVCANHGFNESKNIEEDEGKVRRKCSTMRTGCKAIFTVTKNKKSNKWVVKTFHNDHNHQMVSPNKVSYLRSHKKMSVAAKNLVETFKEEGLPTGKVAALFGDGEENFDERDCWNQLSRIRKKKLDVGDAQTVLNYCKKRQAMDSNFFYAIQCDDEDRMVNFFWVDARSRMAFQYFGDVVTFDTTYKTNKYSMPFAPFTGINHHRQSIMFGCALLQDETEITFVWLFETWVEAMYGKHPFSIITDQDPAIGAAIRRVFPRTRHRLCYWHIKKKFPEKLSHIYHKHSKFKFSLKSCIRDSLTVERFERKWRNLTEEYELQEHEWLKGLYLMRQTWVPAYNRNTFFAGMNTTQRSESMNSFFDSFVNSRTTLSEFVVQFGIALDKRYKMERKEDFNSIHKSRIMIIGSSLEHHAGKVYTRNIFALFQEELVKSNHFIIEKLEKNGAFSIYKVKSSFDAEDSFNVEYDKCSHISKCDCQLFEFTGILCRHVIKVFTLKNIVEIPQHYILNRWTRFVTRKSLTSDGDYHMHCEHSNLEAIRISHISRCTTHLAYLAGRSKDIYNVILSDLTQTLEKVSILENQLLQSEHHTTEDNEEQVKSTMSAQEEVTDMSHELAENECVTGSSNQMKLHNPHISHTKGNRMSKGIIHEKHTGRIKGGMEISVRRALGKRRSCKLCGEHGHNRRSCKSKTRGTSEISSSSLGTIDENMEEQSSDDAD